MQTANERIGCTDDTLSAGQILTEYASGVLTLHIMGDIDHHAAAALRQGWTARSIIIGRGRC